MINGRLFMRNNKSKKIQSTERKTKNSISIKTTIQKEAKIKIFPDKQTPR